MLKNYTPKSAKKISLQKSISNSVSKPGNWVELSKRNFNYNLNQFKNVIGSASLSVVLKSNAYGHGIVEIGSFCQEDENVASVCVFSLSEALTLRESGFLKPILVLGLIDQDIVFAALNNITLTVYSLDIAQQINNVASGIGLKIDIHVKIDSGLSRLGFQLDEALESVKEIKKLANLNIVGIYTHFAESDLEREDYTQLQIQRFRKLISDLEDNFIKIPLRHVANTSAVLRFAHDKSFFKGFNMVRIGGGVYGYTKPFIKTLKNIDLKLVISWKSRIIQIKDVSAGTYISYARTFKTDKDTKIAVIAVGYSDGFSRELSNSGSIFIDNQKANILGRVGMNMVMVDVSHIATVSCDSVAQIVGDFVHGHPDQLAEFLGTISYDILTGIHESRPRLIV